MSTASLRKAMTRATYREVTEVAERVGKALGVKGQNLYRLAEQLVSAFEALDTTDEETYETGMFASHFTRKRAITIQPMKPGYVIRSEGVPDVVCSNLRDGMQEFLDVLVTYKGLHDE